MLRYSKDHVWVKEEAGILRVGLSDFAQGELGEIAFIELPKVDSRITANEPVCSIDSLKSTSDIYAPISGTVREINRDLEVSGSAGAINRDPLGDGWLFTIEPDDPSAIDSLLSASDYKILISPT